MRSCMIESLESRLCLSIAFRAAPHLPGLTLDIAFGDFTSDGIPDLVTWASSSTLGIYAGQGNFTFATTPFRELFTGLTGRIGLADFDRDGLLDIAVSTGNGVAQGVEILRNLGSGTFAQRTFNYSGPDAQGLAILDLNHDGVLDLLVPHNSLWPTSYGSPAGYGAGVLLGNGDATFQPVRKVPLTGPQQVMQFPARSMGPSPNISPIVAFGATVQTSNGYQPLIQIADISDLSAPQVRTIAPFKGTLGGMGVGDLNGDHLLDLVVSKSASVNHAGASTVEALLGQADGTFIKITEVVTDLAVWGPDSLSLADFDRDGNLDVVMSGQDLVDMGGDSLYAKGYIFAGRGDGTFTQSAGPASLTVRQRVEDVNGDSKPDLLILDALQSRTRVLLNVSTPIGGTGGAGATQTTRPGPANFSEARLIDDLLELV